MHCITDPLTESVPLLLKRQCDLTLGERTAEQWRGGGGRAVEQSEQAERSL